MQRVIVLGWLVLPLLLACGEDPPPPPPPPPTVWVAQVLDAVARTPVAEARIQVGGTWQATDASGKLSLELEPGTLEYRVEAPGHRFVPERFTATPTVALVANETTTTEILLWPSRLRSGPGTIRGKVTRDGAPVAGALVVASSAIEGFAYTDDAGAYAITQLNAGEYRVRAFLGGNVGAEAARISVATVTENVDLAMAQGAPGSVTGAVGGGVTRVWLVHPTVKEPIPGLDAVVTEGRYTIAGVPAGSFAIRAGLEEDGLTLDPDPIHQDGPWTVTVTEVAETQDLALLPAVPGLSPTHTASAAPSPSFDWTSVPNADFYVLEVSDLDGASLWGGFDAAGDPRARILQRPVAYAGPALTAGGRYRWRVWAAQNDPIVASQFKLIAASEELGGDFTVLR